MEQCRSGDVRIYNLPAMLRIAMQAGYALTSEQVKQIYNGGAINFR